MAEWSKYSTVVENCCVISMSVCSGVFGFLIDDRKGNKPESPLGQAAVPSKFWVQMLPPT